MDALLGRIILQCDFSDIKISIIIFYMELFDIQD